MRVRRAIKASAHMPRVSVFRSLKNIYVQLIDDTAGKTLLSSSSLAVREEQGDKKAVALAVGKDFAAKAKALGIEAAVFDRGCFRYHGRVEALVQGMRDGGLRI